MFRRLLRMSGLDLMILVVAAIAVVFFANAVFAQDSGAVALSGSNSQSGAQSASGSSAGASAGYTVNNYNDGKNTVEYQGTYDVRNVPAVSAPAVFGGGHPCLAGKSGGLAVLGGGASYGTGTAEPICMLYLLGQPEAAVRLLVMQSPGACKALGNVGYYRVGDSVIPFECGKNVVVGGVDTPGASIRKTRLSTRNARPKARPALYNQCERGANNSVHIRYTGAGKRNKEIAKKACLEQLGY